MNTPLHAKESIADLHGLPLPLPKIGKFWDGQGGIYAGALRNPDNNEVRHIIMHPAAIEKSEWGSYGKKIEGANSYWDSEANTQAMRNSGENHPVIGTLDKLEKLDGHNDYQLASQAALNLLTCNLRDMLDPEWHWSSTQYSADNAWVQNCGDGTQDINYKDSKLAARAVRSILVIE